MASNSNSSLFQCTGCHDELNLESKTLPCFHSFCYLCLERTFEGQTNENGQCPECNEPLILDQLSLSSFLVNPLRRQQLETSDWKCDICFEGEVDSPARKCCLYCHDLFCDKCHRNHKKHQPKHNSIDFDKMGRRKAITMMVTDTCALHLREKDSYCERCNVCRCDKCYKNHPADSPGCSPKPLSVRKEASRQKSKGPSMAKEIKALEMSLKRMNKTIMYYTEELNSDCYYKCRQVQESYEEMMENAKRRTDALCEDMRQMTVEQVESWRQLLEENEKILKQLEIWRINLHHLLNESQQDVDVVCGLRSLGSKLSPQLHKSVEPMRKYQLGFTFPNWWLHDLEQVKNEKFGSVSLNCNIIIDKLWYLRGSNSCISSIHVSKDNHVFICDLKNHSIDEYTEGGGELVCKYLLSDGKKTFEPFDLCSISSDILVVLCWGDKKIIYLKRRKNHPFLQLKNIIDTKERFYSLCEMNETIFACDYHLQIVSFTKEGDKIKRIKTPESWSGYWPRIRGDPTTGNLWVTRFRSSEILCYNQNGEKLRSVKTEKRFFDFTVNNFGWFYFCDFEGIFSSSLKKYLYKFEKRSEFYSTISVLQNKLFVCLENDGKYLIKIFKIID